MSLGKNLIQTFLQNEKSFENFDSLKILFDIRRLRNKIFVGWNFKFEMN